MTLWLGLWAPKGTPKEIVAKINAAVVEALNDPHVLKQIDSLGLQIPPKDQLTPQALGDRQKSEIAKWWPMIKAAHIAVDEGRLFGRALTRWSRQRTPAVSRF